jgi:hypothetical protein
VHAELAERETHVAREVVDQAHTQGIVVLRFHLIEATKLEANSANRFVTLQPLLDIQIDLAVKVKTQFVVNLAIDR